MGRRDLWVYLLVALGGAWLVALPLWLAGGLGSGFPWLAGVMMFTPTLGVLAVRLLDRRVPAREWARATGLTFGPRKGRTVVLLLAAWLGPPLISAAAVALSAAVGVLAVDFDFSLMREGMGGAPPIGVGTIVLIQLVSMVLFAPLINSVPAFGEEWGWRGWLLPRLMEFGTWPALLLSGLIWGVWHAPLTLLGYNYPQLGPWAAVLFTGFCVIYGVLMGWLRLYSGSVWPAVLCHGSFNASAGLPMILGSAAEPPNVVIAGITGLVGWVLMAALALFVTRRWRLDRAPQPVTAA
ncbi:CPBP family intramembrane glutamic endopeptidase [Saccharopolyspora sp. NPDC050642]|uniref:CPBP family intramembrane glutamic endopeptidase n=1 Tax=Saccharopolyspora sp. NPDC050642 TaxID=3157099 RepID=UPI003410C5BB